MSRGFSAVVVTAMGALGACQDPPAQSPPNTPPEAPAPASAAPSVAIAPSSSAMPSAMPSASAVASVAPSASAVAPPPPQVARGAKIAVFIARTLKAPVRPPPSNADVLNQQMTDLTQYTNNACGVSVNNAVNLPGSSGGGSLSTGLSLAATEYIQIGLTPKPGQSPPDRARAMDAIELIESNIARCLPPLARKNPKLFASPITVDAQSAGSGAPTVVTTPKTNATDVSTCITSSVTPALRGDEAAAHIVFTIRIDKPPTQ